MQPKFTEVGRVFSKFRRYFYPLKIDVFCRHLKTLNKMEGHEVSTTERVLLVFDFDHTLIDENSDLSVLKLAPNGKLPEEIANLYSDRGWTKYMGEIFKYLHSIGKTPHNILSCMSEIPLTEGMQELLDFTKSNEMFEHIVISDSNSVFIEHILEQKGMPQVFKTFTNPAKFQDDGCLILDKYHRQDWCDLSTDNLCKGHILKEFISERKKNGVSFHNVLYVGDGSNDLCPGLTLRPQDFLLPRTGFNLMKILDKIVEKDEPVPKSRLNASVKAWGNGREILQLVRSLPFVKGSSNVL